MRRFRYYILFIIIFFAVTYFAIPAYYRVTPVKTAGPWLDSAVHQGYRSKINDEKPAFVLLGDSYLDTGVDEGYLNELTGQTYLKIAKHGSASAMWYLLLKNNIVTARNKPEYVVILFRGSMLTTPEFRTTGTYLNALDEYASPEDKRFIELAYLSQMSKAELFLEQYFPLYAYRQLVRTSIDRVLKYPLPYSLLKKDVDEVNSAMNAAFGDPEIAQLNAIINAAEAYLYQPSKLDFESQLPRSFLPDVIKLCQENGIWLIFVREKVIEFPTEDSQPEGLADYTLSLKKYLEENNAIFFDFAFDPHITTDLFYDSLHMTEEGQTIFTEILAETLNETLP